MVVKPISSSVANRIIRELHYSGKTAPNSQVHLGVFAGSRCGGAIQFGPSLNRRSMANLVRGTAFRECIELNRFALADWLPKNSESRVLAVSLRLLQKSYAHLKWVVSFADATQCGDGTIYRACGFVLTAIRESTELLRLPDGSVVHSLAVHNTANKKRPELGGRTLLEVANGTYSNKAYAKAAGAEVLPGFQLRYLYFLKPECRRFLTVPELPYSAIDTAGAGMYRGIKRGKHSGDAPGDQPGEGGSNPTSALHTT